MKNLLTLIIVTSILSIVCSTRNIAWEDVAQNMGEFVLWRPTPAGIEGRNNFIFLCRAHEVGVWIPGKLSVWNDQVHCHISKDGFGIRHLRYQMLNAPYGSVSWVEANGETPLNAIVGGIRANGNNAYICRGNYDGHLIVGSYNEPACKVSYGFKEHVIVGNIEVLVKNMYGLHINA